MNQDHEQIRILSIFHFVVAGIAGLIACFPIFHLAIGISMLVGGILPGSGMGVSGGERFPFMLFGLLFTVLPAVIITLGWTFAICLALAGYFLQKQRHYMFCLVMAGLSCMFSPFGTVLGVFTIVVLTRPTVKQLFQPAAPVPQDA